MNAFSEVNTLWNCNDEAMWLRAFHNYYNLLALNQLPLEREIEQINCKEISAFDVDDFYRFLHEKYYVWKYTAKNRLATTRKQLERYIMENRISELDCIRRNLFAMEHSNVRECLSVACKIRGLGTAGASGLLAVLFPEDFGTVDQFVVKSLLEIDGLKEHQQISLINPDSIKIDDGVILINILRNKALLLNRQFDTSFWTPRKIDMILWSIGR